MSESAGVILTVAAVGGVVVGLMYFATLWWTVQRIATARQPALLVAGSFVVRAVVAAGGIVLVSQGKPLPLAVAVGGFLLGRTVMIRKVGAPLARAAAAAGGRRRDSAAPDRPGEG